VVDKATVLRELFTGSVLNEDAINLVKKFEQFLDRYNKDLISNSQLTPAEKKQKALLNAK
jgi:hypothetical protein